MKNKKIKNIINILAIFIFSFGVIFLIIKDDFNSIIQSIRTSKWIFLVIAITFHMLYQMIEGLCNMILARRYKKDYTYKEGYINGLIGTCFSYITPSATGGQISQAYAYSKQGIKLENSASILVVNFIAYELVLIIYSGIALLVNYNYLNTNLGSFNIFGINTSFIVLVLIGFLINLLGIVLILLISYSKLVNKLVKSIVRLLGKIKLIRKADDKLEAIDQKIASYRNNLSDIKNYYPRFIIIILLTFLRCTIYYIAPAFCALSLGISINLSTLLLIIALSSFVVLVATYVPVPGASGGNEFFFYLLFTPIFIQNEALSSAMIMWRFITFYVPLIYSSIVTCVFNYERKAQLLDSVPTRYRNFFDKHSVDIERKE